MTCPVAPPIPWNSELYGPSAWPQARMSWAQTPGVNLRQVAGNRLSPGFPLLWLLLLSHAGSSSSCQYYKCQSGHSSALYPSLFPCHLLPNSIQVYPDPHTHISASDPQSRLPGRGLHREVPKGLIPVQVRWGWRWEETAEAGWEEKGSSEEWLQV